MTNRVWITWENQRRNRTLSPFLSAKLYEFDIRAPAVLRYPIAISKTLFALAKERPNVIISQNPSLILALLSIIISYIFNKTLIIDAHNAGLYPLEGRYKFLNWVSSKICKWADLTIVSNIELEKHVINLGGKAISIPDPIPNIKPPNVIPKLKGDFNVLFICSWANDEPFLEVIRASERVDEYTYIYITGHSKGFEKKYGKKLPRNVILTGYVSEEEYSGLLYACDSIMVLTRRENCLLCGAYEGVAVMKPLILSKTKALKKHFRKGSVYTENNNDSIINALNNVRHNFISLANDIADLKEQHNIEFMDINEKGRDIYRETFMRR